METRINYMLVGLFVVILTVSLIIAGVWLSTGLSQKKYATYLVYLDESVSGLNVKAPVKYNGVQVGYVANLELDKNNTKQVILYLNIEEGTPVSVDTRAKLDTQGLTGVSYLELTGGGGDSTPLQANEGEKFPIIENEPSLLFRLDMALDNLTKHIQGVSVRINEFLSKQNLAAISEALDNAKNVTQTFSNNTQEIDRIIDNSDLAIQQLPNTVKNINAAGEQAINLVQRLAQLAEKADTITQTINQQVLPKTNHILDQTTLLFQDMQSLTQQLKDNPAALIRGYQPLPPGPGEK